MQLSMTSLQEVLKKHSGQWLTLFLLKPFQTTMNENAEQLEEIAPLYGKERTHMYTVYTSSIVGTCLLGLIYTCSCHSKC